ncbi:MAG: DUF4384 domain-containing protein [Pseudomonadota bacterium]
MHNKLIINLLFTFQLMLIITAHPVLASMFDTPVAMITSIEGNVNFENTTDRQVDFGTDIFIGDMLKTGKDASLSLTFYNGCRQEIIAQQSLIQVGSNQSIIRNGSFKQVDVLDCEIPKAILQKADSHLKAGLVVRGIDKGETSPIPTPLINPKLKPLINKNGFQLKAWTNNGKQPIFKVGEPILIHFLSNQDAYLRISYFSSNGFVYQLTPELSLKENKIIAKKLYSLGNTHTGLIAGLPTGIDTIYMIASNKPIKINEKGSSANDYYQAIKHYIENNHQQVYSEKQIKLTISQ